MVSLEAGLLILAVLAVISTVFRRRVLQPMEMQVLRRVAVFSEYGASVVAMGGTLLAAVLTPFEAEAPSSRSDRTGASRAGGKPTPPRPTHSS
jgi:hypothetical protein